MERDHDDPRDKTPHQVVQQHNHEIEAGEHDFGQLDELRRTDSLERGQDNDVVFDGEVCSAVAADQEKDGPPEGFAAAASAPTYKVAPDIPKPKGMLPEWAIWGALSLLVIGGGWYAYQLKASKAVKAKPQIILKDAGVPDDFFYRPEKPLVPDVVEVAPPAPPVSHAKPAIVEEKKLTATDLFDAQPVPPAPPVDPAIALAESENEARRGTGITKVALSGVTGAKASDFVNTQDKFDDEEQQAASYPVNLERVVTVDRFIHATLINGINAELAGKVIAQIDENIYGAHGSFVLIPAGSRAIGRYKATMKAGDERFDMFWSRIITPDGINIHLGDAEMTDAMGRAGITGDVDNRFWDRYGMALLVSSIGIAGSVVIPVTNQSQAVIIQQYGTASMNLAQQILDKNINLKPKITIEPGQPILISPSRDIWFKKPERRISVAVALDELKGVLK